MDTQGPFHWRIDAKAPPVGAGLLEGRLRECLDHLSSRFGVGIPSCGRHRSALDVLRQWNESTEPIDVSNEEELGRLTEAHRLAWETYLIVAAAIEDRRNPRTPFTRDKLSDIMDGDLLVEGRNAFPRNTQFELYLAAMLRLPGSSVYRGEPDLRLLYGTSEVGIAVKRIRSTSDDQVQKNARDAARQIETHGLRGWIALNLDSRFTVVNYSQHEDALLAEFSETFNSVTSALRRPALKPHVLGFILLGHVHSWHPPLEGTTEPRLHWSAPMRWQGLTDAPGEEELFHEFTAAWSERWAARRRTLTSKAFTGLL